MDSQVLTEAQLLARLPAYSRIVSPTQRVLIRHPDGVWWNRANGARTNAWLQSSVPPERRRARLHANGNWLKIQTSSGTFPPNNAPWQPAAPLQVLLQTIYRSGPAPVDDCVVPFNIPMSAAAQGRVPDATGHAFLGKLAEQDKATIRFGLQYVELSGYRPRQHNLRRYGAPVMRGQLAIGIAEDVRNVMAALKEIGRPLTLPSGRRVTFDEIILVDIRRVSQGSLQPTLAVRGA